MERRSRDRCPVCQGPTRVLENNELRCRNSVCAYNHKEQACPRCKHKGAEVQRFEDEVYYFACKECQNTWTQPVAFLQRS